MSIKVHHAVARKAAKLGFTFHQVEDAIFIQYAGFDIASGKSPTDLLEIAITKLEQGTAPAGAVEKWREANPPKAKKAPVAKQAKPAKAPAKKAAKKARRKAEDEESEDGDEEEQDEDDEPAEGKSVVKRKYKQRYRPFKHRNGDELANLVSDHVAEREDGEIVEPRRIDPKRLKKFAQANDAWRPEYANLNPGMQRMNVVNRIRAKVRRDDYEVVWA